MGVSFLMLLFLKDETTLPGHIELICICFQHVLRMKKWTHLSSHHIQAPAKKEQRALFQPQSQNSVPRYCDYL